AAQAHAVARGEAAPISRAFPRPIHDNVLPLCDTFRDDGYSTEEIKLLDETRKILADPALTVAMTCVRVPVPVGHAFTALIETERPVTPAEARATLAAFPGVRVVDDPAENIFPTPLDVAGSDDVLVGRVRQDLTSDRLWLWA